MVEAEKSGERVNATQTNFQRHPTLRYAILLCGAAIVLVCASISWGQTVFALQPGDADALKPLGVKGSTRITVNELKLAEGLTIRGRRSWAPSFWAENVATCRKLGKPYSLLVMGGDESDPTKESHLTAVEAHARQLAAVYGFDPLFRFVHVTGCSPSGHSEELYWGRPMPAKVLAANKRLISFYAATFPMQKIILAGSANDPAAIRELIKHGVTVAPGRFVYKMNAMSPKAPLTWNGVTLLADAARLGAYISYEALQPSNHPNFGGTWAQFCAKVKEIERMAGKQFVYEAIYRFDLPNVGGLP
jgi:hypothetical protein